MAATILNIQAVLAPLIVAAMCLFAWRKQVGGAFLIHWAIAHVAIAVTLAGVSLAQIGPDSWSLALAWSVGAVGLNTACWSLLFGVLAIDRPPIKPSWAAAIIIGSSLIILPVQVSADVVFRVGTLGIGAAMLVISAVILLLRRRSIFYVIAAVICLLRAANAVTYVAAVIRNNGLLLPDFTLASTTFINLAMGMALLLLAFDNAQRRLQQSMAAARDAKRESEAILDLAPVSIVRKDRALRLVQANRYFLQMAERFRAGREELPALRRDEFLPPDAVRQMEDLDRQVLANPSKGSLERELTFRYADGSNYTMLVRKAAVLDENGQPDGVVSVALDISRQKETEARLREHAALAESASRAKSQFLANMSHELRTPLNAILGFSEMLTAGYLGKLTDRQQDYINNIRRSGEHLLQLVSDILDLSRIEAGKVDYNPEAVKIGSLIQEVIGALAPLAREAEVALVHEPGGAVSALADRRALFQILINLVGNAVKFSPAGSRVVISARQQNGKTRIRVSDSGTGMTPEQIAQVGEPFLRASALTSRERSGHGLGLAICKSLIAIHGGRLILESEKGKGTTATIEW